MNRNDDLFYLVKSLSKPEKRFFQLFAGATGGGKHYMELFQLLEKQKTYDDDALKKQLAKKGLGKNLAWEKTYLYRTLLKALRSLHSESTFDLQVRSFNIDAEILTNKLLIEPAEKIAQRTLTLCLEKETRLDHINESLKQLDIVYGFKEATATNYRKWRNLLLQQQSIQRSMVNLTEMRLMNSELVYLSKRFGVAQAADQKTLKKMLKHPILSGKTKLLTPQEQIMSILIKGLIYYRLGMLDKEAEMNLKALEYYERCVQKGVFFYTTNFIQALSNYINGCIELTKLKGLEKYLDKYESIRANAPHDIAKSLHGISGRDRMRYYAITNNLTAGKKLIKDFAEDVHPEHRFIAHYYYALLLFRSNHFRESSGVIHNLLDSEKGLSLDSFFKPLRILQLLNYYELKDSDLLYSRAVAAKRALEQRKELDAFGKTLISFFISVASGTKRKGVSAMKAELLSSYNKKIQQPEMRELELENWIRSQS